LNPSANKSEYTIDVFLTLIFIEKVLYCLVLEVDKICTNNPIFLLCGNY
jgi:hypothetical protein